MYFNFWINVLWIIELIILGVMALYDNTFAKEFFHSMFDVSQYHTKDLRRAHLYSIYLLNFIEPIIWIVIFWNYKKKRLDKEDKFLVFPVFLIVLAYIPAIERELQSHNMLLITLDILVISMLIYIVYAIKKGYVTKIENENSAKKFIELYKMTMSRQEIITEIDKLKRMENLIKELIKKNMAKLYASYDEKNELGSMAVFCWDNKRAYYLFGASDPSKRNGHSGTNVLWEAFCDLSRMGIDIVDLEGVNSPARGWFKLSFGADIRPYYEVKFGM